MRRDRRDNRALPLAWRRCQRAADLRSVDRICREGLPRKRPVCRTGVFFTTGGAKFTTDGVGFEPTVRYERTHTFQACALNHSATRPKTTSFHRNKQKGPSTLRPLGSSIYGQGEIRTLDTLAGMPVFETGAFNHSATCPTASKPIWPRQANQLFGHHFAITPFPWRVLSFALSRFPFRVTETENERKTQNGGTGNSKHATEWVSRRPSNGRIPTRLKEIR